MLTRRTLAAAATALPLFAVKRACAAEFSFRLGHPLPASHPLNVRGAEACSRIAAATDGRVSITVHPDSQLGPDSEALKKLRAGEIEMMAAFGLVLSTVAPVASLPDTPFAFKSYAQVWSAMDGALGALLRQGIAQSGYVPIGRTWDNGFRHVTSSTKPVRSPEDLHGLKIRVPVSPLAVSMFKALGAEPTGLNFSELYAALQTHVLEGEENSLFLIENAKLNEVQRYCSLTNHIWDGFWILVNQQAWGSLPSRFQDLVEAEFDRAGQLQRDDMAHANPGLRGDLAMLGMEINPVLPSEFQQVLRGANFYAGWRDKFGEKAWEVLENSAGRLS